MVSASSDAAIADKAILSIVMPSQRLRMEGSIAKGDPFPSLLLERYGAGRRAVGGVAGYCLLTGVSGPVLAPLPRMLLSPKVSIKAPLSICQPWVGLSIKVD